MACLALSLLGRARRYHAKIDARFVAAVGAYNWSLLGTRANQGYAARSDKPQGRARLLHQFVWRLAHGTFAPALDHKNRNGLDCRLSNLRVATAQDNNRNQGIRRDNKSGYKGVSKDRNRWRATIIVDREQIQLGNFGTREEAARAYNAGARAYFGRFAAVNKVRSL